MKDQETAELSGSASASAGSDSRENGAGPAGSSGTVRVMSEQGLHARPAARLAKAAQQFRSEIVLRLDGQEADAKSILDILSLAAAKGSEMHIEVLGEDEDEALGAMLAFFETSLGEDS